MSPVYLNPQHSSTIPFLELKGDQQQKLPTIMDYVHDHVTNTSNNYNYNNYFSGSNLSNHHTSIDFLAMDYSRCTQNTIVEKFLSHDKHIVYPYDNRADKIEIIKSDKNSKKCKPTKLRIMQRPVTVTTTATKSKKISEDQHVEQPKHRTRTSRNEANGIRMCTDCHTTTTPLWRSGPHGPKSLCNACGIRQRKARRAAAMAAELAKAEVETEVETVNSPMSSSTTFEPPKQAIVVDYMTSKIQLDHDNKIHTLPLKKRCKNYNNDFWTYNNNNNNNINCQNDKNNHFDEDHSKDAFSQRVFLKDDEEEGAILLMELSCGMGCSS